MLHFLMLTLFAAGMITEAERVQSVGKPLKEEKVTLTLLTQVMDDLLSSHVAEVDIDPKAFDFNPKAPSEAENQADTAGIKFLSRIINKNEPTIDNIAYVDNIPHKDDPHAGMYLIPGTKQTIESTERYYDRRPTTTITQNGRTIITNYPRENWEPLLESEPFLSEERGFYIDKNAVTYADYDRYLQSTRRPLSPRWNQLVQQKGNDPIVGITYDEAVAYANWAGMRLPRYTDFQRAMRLNPDMRRLAPSKEWTSTISNPSGSAKRYQVIGASRDMAPDEVDQNVGFRLAHDER